MCQYCWITSLRVGWSCSWEQLPPCAIARHVHTRCGACYLQDCLLPGLQPAAYTARLCTDESWCRNSTASRSRLISGQLGVWQRSWDLCVPVQRAIVCIMLCLYFSGNGEGTSCNKKSYCDNNIVYKCGGFQLSQQFFLSSLSKHIFSFYSEIIYSHRKERNKHLVLVLNPFLCSVWLWELDMLWSITW